MNPETVQFENMVRNYLAGNVVAERAGTTWTKGYVYLNGQLVAQYSNGTTYFVHKDHLGSTRLLTKLDKSPLEAAYDYLPFGEPIGNPGSGTTHKFTGQERDTESGLDYFGARIYESQTGRFLSADPISLVFPPPPVIRDPQQLNSYANARNNPLVFKDEDGNFSRYVHAMITEEAASRLGYSLGTIRDLKEANLDVDRPSNQLNNPEHGMTDLHNTVDDILGAIQKRLDNAVNEALEGRYVGATFQLGQGLHIVQDFVAHEGEGWKDHGLRQDTKINDRDPHKLNTANLQSQEFLKKFGNAIIKAAGKQRGQKIIDAVKKADSPSQKKSANISDRKGHADMFVQGNGGRCGIKICGAYE